jgi:hypothetical protein
MGGDGIEPPTSLLVRQAAAARSRRCRRPLLPAGEPCRAAVEREFGRLGLSGVRRTNSAVGRSAEDIGAERRGPARMLGVTLVLDMAVGSMVLHVGDRLLTRDDSPWDPLANKSVVLLGSDGWACLSYSGLAISIRNRQISGLQRSSAISRRRRGPCGQEQIGR